MKLLQKKDKKKYYCLERNRWVTEYLVFGKWTVYKLSLYGKKDRWSLRASKKPMYGPVKTEVYMTESEAYEKFGAKINWPVTPYKYIKG